MQIVLRRRAYEEVVLSGKELQASGLWREGPERDREVHCPVRFIAHRYYPGIRIRYPTCFVLFFRDLNGMNGKRNIGLEVSN